MFSFKAQYLHPFHCISNRNDLNSIAELILHEITMQRRCKLDVSVIVHIYVPIDPLTSFHVSIQFFFIRE